MKRGIIPIVLLSFAMLATGCVTNTPERMSDVVPGLNPKHESNKQIYDNQSLVIHMKLNATTGGLETSEVTSTIVPKAALESERIAAWGSWFYGVFGGTGQFMTGLGWVKHAFDPETQKYKISQNHSGNVGLNGKVTHGGKVDHVNSGTVNQVHSGTVNQCLTGNPTVTVNGAVAVPNWQNAPIIPQTDPK